ncbi:MAG: HXXEE domain-containing protein [Clostridiales bacterium]|nr:HXXEE domain-containing protein [Clostridiales bacterium]
MNYYRRHWYDIGGIFFVALAFIMGFWGGEFSRLQVILIYSFMALLVHQIEEYAWPGGFPAIYNIAVAKEKAAPDRYPLNANQCMITNGLIKVFYLTAILLPDVIWLGFAQVLFGMLQFFAHGLLINIRLKSFYNPGLASVIFLHLPIGIYYIRYTMEHDLIQSGAIILGILAASAAGALTAALPILLLRDRASKYPFTEDEMNGYAKDKLDRIRKS